MIEAVVQSLLPGRAHRAVASSHPYTLDGLQIDVMEGRQWIEIGECGLALPALLLESGLDTEAHSGLAMGLGLDRILMLRKGLDDIRLLRASDPRISSQLLDLTRYRPVSSMPPVRRDLSLVLPEEATAEELGAQVRGALQERASVIEQVEILSETGCQDLPEKVIARLGMREGQKNVLLRVVLRALDRTLTDEECNQLRDVIYRALHQGPQTEWCAPSIERPE